MPMTGSACAAFIASAMGQVGTPQFDGWGFGIVLELQTNGLVSHVAGKVTGITAAGSALSAGAATDGKIAGISGSSLETLVKTNSGGSYPFSTSELLNFCTVIADHIKSKAKVIFALGNITGQCTSTVITAGPLTNGAGTNGIVQTGSMNGTTIAQDAVIAVPFVPPPATPELIDFCTAIVDYIEANAQITYALGSVIGTCPIASGALVAGAGSGGTIL